MKRAHPNSTGCESRWTRGPHTKKCRKSPEAIKGKSLQKGIRPCETHVKLNDLQNCELTNWQCFQAAKCVVTCSRSGHKYTHCHTRRVRGLNPGVHHVGSRTTGPFPLQVLVFVSPINEGAVADNGFQTLLPVEMFLTRTINTEDGAALLRQWGEVWSQAGGNGAGCQKGSGQQLLLGEGIGRCKSRVCT